MFGLTRREQRWKADQQAATLLVGLASVAIKARAEMDVAESNAKAIADTLELEQLRAENLRLQTLLEEKNSADEHTWIGYHSAKTGLTYASEEAASMCNAGPVTKVANV